MPGWIQVDGLVPELAAATAAVMHSEPLDRSLCLWGKSRGLDSPYLLAGHLLDTAAAARVICEEVVPDGMVEMLEQRTGSGRDGWVAAVVVLAGWHDIGKATCGFQQQVPDAAPRWLVGHSDGGSPRHDTAGGYLVCDRLAGLPGSMTAAQIVGGHHGVIPRLDRQWLRAYSGAERIDHNPPPSLICGPRMGVFPAHAGMSLST